MIRLIHYLAHMIFHFLLLVKYTARYLYSMLLEFRLLRADWPIKWLHTACQFYSLIYLWRASERFQYDLV